MGYSKSGPKREIYSTQLAQVALVVRNPPTNAGDLRDAGLIPGLGRSPGKGNGTQFQCSCPENPVNRGALKAMVHRVAKSWPQVN